jgi:sec-independent protein translocase protein TatB
VTAAHGQLSLQFMVIVPTVQIASLGMADSLILMVMALVVFGPRRLPQIGRQIGKLMYEFRKASNDFKFQMEEELRNSEEADRRKKEEERLRALALAAPAPAPAEALTPALTAGTETPAADALTAETVNPAAIYDNGPVAMTQAADTAPTIMPPSIGETVAAARGWSLKHEQARLAEASKAVAAPATVATELRAPTSESDPAPSAPAGSESAPPETITAERASSEAHPDAAAQPPGIAVNHHG